MVALGVLNAMVPHLWLYLRYWWNELDFSSSTITLDRLYHTNGGRVAPFWTVQLSNHFMKEETLLWYNRGRGVLVCWSRHLHVLHNSITFWIRAWKLWGINSVPGLRYVEMDYVSGCDQLIQIANRPENPTGPLNDTWPPREVCLLPVSTICIKYWLYKNTYILSRGNKHLSHQ